VKVRSSAEQEAAKQLERQKRAQQWLQMRDRLFHKVRATHALLCSALPPALPQQQRQQMHIQ
jgi:hypothetical protein